MTINPDIVIGVVLYNNSRSQVKSLCEAIDRNFNFIEKKSKKITYQIIFFQNDKNDYSYLKKDQIYTVGKNIGFGRAHNYLMKVAFQDRDAKLYWCLNPDASPKYDALFNMLEFYYDYGPDVLIEGIQFPAEHPKRWDPASFEVEWVSGFSMLLNKDLFLLSGGFDPNIFLYCEDVDFSWMAKKLGYKLLICPKALVFHDVDNRETLTNKNQIIQMHISGYYLGKKWGNENFSNFCEQILVEYHIDPPYDHVEPILDLNFQPNFSNKFSFSRNRWD